MSGGVADGGLSDVSVLNNVLDHVLDNVLDHVLADVD